MGKGKLTLKEAAIKILALSSLLLLTACADPIVGGWTGKYDDLLYPNSDLYGKDLVAYFQFCDDGKMVVDLTGQKTADPSLVTPTRQWGTWREDKNNYAFEIPAPAIYPKFDYLWRGVWIMDADLAKFTVWDRLFPTFSDGKAIGTAQRSELELPCTPETRDAGR